MSLLTTIVSGFFAFACALTAAVYKEPKAYKELIQPILKWIYISMYILAGGILLGHFMVGIEVAKVVPGEQVAILQKTISDSSFRATYFAGGGAFVLMLDVLLFVIASKAAAWKKTKGEENE